MITIYAADAVDFGGLGLGALDPIDAVVEEEAGGKYEAEVIQPIRGDGRHLLVANQRILRIPTPVQECPELTFPTVQATPATPGTAVTREIYRVTANVLRLRSGPGTGYKTMGYYTTGAEVVRLSSSGSWYKVVIVAGGASGWMHSSYLTYDRTETETVTPSAPAARVVTPTQAREQLFRIYKPVRDSKNRQVIIHAQHISYDLRGVLVAGEYDPENVPADQVCAGIMARADHAHDFQVHCAVTTPISGSFGGKNVLNCLLAKEEGVAAKAGARVIRDNYDIYLLPDVQRKPGAELRYGKNLLSAELTEDIGSIWTRIRPVGRDDKGDPLYITANNGYVESPRAARHPVIYTTQVEYDVQVGKDGIADEAAARAKLTELALADFDAGLDAPTVSLDADFVRLELTEQYRALANACALHLYDIAPVIDPEAGIRTEARMTGYIWDALHLRYTRTSLGELTDVEMVIQGYDLAAGSVSTAKLVSGAVTAETLSPAVWTRIQEMIAAAAGNSAGLLAPPYNAQSDYSAGDYVIHGGKLYRCPAAIHPGEAWNPAHWTEVCLAEELLDAKADLRNHDMVFPLDGGEITITQRQSNMLAVQIPGTLARIRERTIATVTVQEGDRTVLLPDGDVLFLTQANTIYEMPLSAYFLDQYGQCILLYNNGGIPCGQWAAGWTPAT